MLVVELPWFFLLVRQLNFWVLLCKLPILILLSQMRSVNPGTIGTCWSLLAVEWKVEGSQDSSVPTKCAGCWGFPKRWVTTPICLVFWLTPLRMIANSWLCQISCCCSWDWIFAILSHIPWFSCWSSWCHAPECSSVLPQSVRKAWNFSQSSSTVKNG